MAETLLSLADQLQLGQAVSAVSEEASLADKARAWYLEAIHHPLWVDYIKNSEEDEGFYIGGERQWSMDGSLEDAHRLKKANRAVLSINHCQTVVDVLTGYERGNRSDIRAEPQGDEDVEDSQLLSWLLKFVQDQTETHEFLSDAFEDGMIRGMSVIEAGIDWLNDPVNGEIVLTKLTPGVDCLWDPYWTRYDFSDSRYFIRFRWGFVDDLAAEHPDHAAALKLLRAGVSPRAPVSPGLTTDGSSLGADAYGSVATHATEQNIHDLFYDAAGDRVLVLEVWYLDYERIWLVLDKEASTIEWKSEGEAGDAAAAQAIAQADPKRLSAIMRRQRKIRMGTVIPATGAELESDAADTPYEKDPHNYPFVPFIAKKKRHTVYGIIRNLKDPQRVENKRISQVMDIIARYSNIRPMAEEGSVINPVALADTSSTDPVYYKRGQNAPGWYAPPLAELSRVLVELALQMRMAIREIPGINPDLLGLKSDDSSGIAIARRQQQGQVISTSFFSNLKRTRKLLGQRLAARIQEVFTTEQTLRLTTDSGTPVTVRLNPREYKHLTATQFKEFRQQQPDPSAPKILRDVSALKYDIVISESPATPTARHTALLALLEIVDKLPQLLPDMIEEIVELADIPNRAKILQRLQARMAALNAPPAPSGGGVPVGGVSASAGAGTAAMAMPPVPAVPPVAA